MIEKRDEKKHVKKRWFIMFLFVVLLSLLYWNGRDFHITEDIGEREVELFE